MELCGVGAGTGLGRDRYLPRIIKQISSNILLADFTVSFIFTNRYLIIS